MKNKIIALFFGSFVLGYLASFISFKKQGGVQMDGFENSQVLATIDGNKITFEEILPEAQDIISSLERQKYELLKQKIKDRFLATEVAPHEKSEVNNEDLQKYSTQRNIDISKINNQQLNDLKENFKIFNRFQSKIKYFDDLESSGKIKWSLPIKFLLKQTSMPRNKGIKIYGKSEKNEYLIVTNYHCPSCKTFYSRIDQDSKSIENLSNASILPIANPIDNSIATTTVMAFHCINELGKAKEFHSALIENTPQILDGIFQIATKIGVSAKDVEKCISDRKFLDRIAADYRWAEESNLLSGVVLANGYIIPIQENTSLISQVLLQN